MGAAGREACPEAIAQSMRRWRRVGEAGQRGLSRGYGSVNERVEEGGRSGSKRLVQRL